MNTEAKNKKHLSMVAAGAAGAAALTLGLTGVAAAQTEDPTVTEPAESVETPADSDETQNGRSRGFGRDRQAKIDQLVADGVITQEQADDMAAVRAAIIEQRTQRKTERAQGIADTLGIAVEDLAEAREQGQSLAEIAGDDLPALVDYVVGQATDRIAAALDDGRITQEQADQKLDGLEERVENRLDKTPGKKNRRGHNRTGQATSEA